ncbi:hypothetical protein ACIPUB_17360 [Paeniglutamicibacter sp. ORCA_105]
MEQEPSPTSLLDDLKSPSRTALSARIVEGTEAVPAPAPNGTDDTVVLQGLLDAGASAIRLRSFATYKVASLIAPNRAVVFFGIGSIVTALSGAPVIAKNGRFPVALEGIRVNLLSEANDVTDAITGETRMIGRRVLRNERSSPAGVADEANFAGQGVSRGIIGWVKHHYTDSTMMQMDNVGDGTALILKNAHNPARRRDKSQTYVGQGAFLRLSTHDQAAGFARDQFFMDKDAKLVWTGGTRTGTGGAAKLLSNKADDGTYAYNFELTNKHLNAANFFGIFEVRNDVTHTRAVFRSMTSQTTGMILDTAAGDLTLSARAGAGLIYLTSRLRFNRGADITTTAGAVVKYLTVHDQTGGIFKIPLHLVA